MKTRIFVMVICAAALLSAGCEQMLRKAPAEELKQAAQIQTDVSDQILVTGCEPDSETAHLLKESAEIVQRYIGLPRRISRNRWETLAKAKDSAYDPVTLRDVTTAADKWLGIAEAILTPQMLAALGLGAVGIGGWIKKARQVARTAGTLAAVKDGVNKFMAQAQPNDAAKLYKDIEGKKGKVNSANNI